jgi:hypothetical protein
MTDETKKIIVTVLALASLLFWSLQKWSEGLQRISAAAVIGPVTFGCRPNSRGVLGSRGEPICARPQR